MTKKRKNKKKIYIITVVIIVILLLICFIYEQSLDNAKYKQLADIGSIEKAVTSLGCKFSKFEISTDQSYQLDIYLTADKDLYTDGKSNESFYNMLIQKLADTVNYQSFRIIDKKNDNQIDVICSYTNQEIYRIYINGEYNYYSNEESKKVLREYQKTKETNLNIQSNEINTLIQNQWNIQQLNLPQEDIVNEKYYIYADLGLEIQKVQNKVFNIIFNLQYTNNVVNNLKPGDSLENIIQVLGEPTFGNIEEELIGYKGKDIYVFFTPEEISIYEVAKQDEGTVFQDLVAEYQQKRIEKDFVTKVTDIWQDYDNYQYDAYTIDLSYTLRGIKIQYGVTKNHGIIVYQNYTGKILDNKTLEELKNETEIQIPEFIYFTKEDSVYEKEKERVGQIRAILNGDIEEPEDYFELED